MLRLSKHPLYTKILHSTQLRYAHHTNHYEVLKLQSNCTPKEIREAFIRLSKELHPDANVSNANKKANEKSFVQLLEAYKVLSKPDTRSSYDYELALKARPQPHPGGSHNIQNQSPDDGGTRSIPKPSSLSTNVDEVGQTFSAEHFPEVRTQVVRDVDVAMQHPVFPLSYSCFGTGRDSKYPTRRLRPYSRMMTTTELPIIGTKKKKPYWYPNASHYHTPDPNSFYGIKGLKKVSNWTIVWYCLVFMVLGIVVQAYAISKSFTFKREQLDEDSRKNSLMLAKARAEAQSNGNDAQLERMKAKLNKETMW